MTYQKAQSLLFPPPGIASLNTESFVALMDGLPALEGTIPEQSK